MAQVLIQIAHLVDLAIDDNDNLVIIHDSQSNDPTIINLGIANKHRFKTLKSYVARLSVNAIDA